VAADIQEYARLLASALLAGPAVDEREAALLLERAEEHALALRTPALQELIGHERRAVVEATGGDVEGLASIAEAGSILRAQREGPPACLGEAGDHLAAAAAELPADHTTVLTRYYGGVYFSYEQALWLDALATAARELGGPARDVALGAVMSVASDVVSSVGNHFAQPMRTRGADGRPKRPAVRAVARRRAMAVEALFRAWLERYAALPDPGHDAIAVRGDFRDVLADPPAEIGVVYADPPYTRDHYSRYYHVLETIAIGDAPDVSQMRLGSRSMISRGLYRDERHQSPFCIKSQAPGAFAALFAGARSLDAPLVLSYSPYGEGSASRPRLMTVEDIVALAREHYADVDVASAGRLAHSKLNASRLNFDVVYDAELLITCRP
jgi:hypothetical protein